MRATRHPARMPFEVAPSAARYFYHPGWYCFYAGDRPLAAVLDPGPGRRAGLGAVCPGRVTPTGGAKQSFPVFSGALRGRAAQTHPTDVCLFCASFHGSRLVVACAQELLSLIHISEPTRRTPISY